MLYLTDGPDLVVVASNGGQDWAPSWWLNLQADPMAWVEVDGERYLVRAEQADPAKRVRLWAELVAMYPDYDKYQQRVTRTIPLVRLHPVAIAAFA